MTLNSISDQELFEKIRSLSQEERRITSEILHLLREISRRRLYAKRGHESLFTFLVKELGYDEASAYRRVSAIRVIEAIPEIEKTLEDGKLTVATVAQAQSFFQQEKKRAKPCSTEKKREILKKLEGKSKREAERILAAEAPEVPKPDQTRTVSETATEIRFTADAELFEMIKQIQALTAHHKLEPGYNGLLKFIAAQALQKLDPARQKERRLSPEKVAVQHASMSRFIPVSLKREVWKKSGGSCTYVSPLTGKRCGSRHALQLDHITPYAMGGETSAGNLRLLCASHNRLAAATVYGEKKMKAYYRTSSSIGAIQCFRTASSCAPPADTADQNSVLQSPNTIPTSSCPPPGTVMK